MQIERFGGNGSAFEQVPRLNIPSSNSQWVPNMLNRDHPEPPVLSVTAPLEDTHEPGHLTLNIPDQQPKLMTSPGSSGRNSPSLEGENDGEIFHKKFDKWRKKYPVQHSDHEESKRMEGLTLNDKDSENLNSSCSQMETEYVSEQGQVKTEKMRKSAGEAHPQLLAQLNAAPQFSIHPAFGASTQNMPVSDVNRRESRNNVVLTVPQTAFMNRLSPSHSPNNQSKSTPIMEEILNRQETSPRSVEQYNGSPQNRDNFSCPENHAHTVSHLKDKLMRKIDSSENLNLGQGQCQADGNQTYVQSYPNGQVNVTTMQQMYPGQQFYQQGYPPQVRMETSSGLSVCLFVHGRIEIILSEGVQL